MSLMSANRVGNLLRVARLNGVGHGAEISLRRGALGGLRRDRGAGVAAEDGVDVGARLGAGPHHHLDRVRARKCE